MVITTFVSQFNLQTDYYNIIDSAKIISVRNCNALICRYNVSTGYHTHAWDESFTTLPVYSVSSSSMVILGLYAGFCMSSRTERYKAGKSPEFGIVFNHASANACRQWLQRYHCTCPHKQVKFASEMGESDDGLMQL